MTRCIEPISRFQKRAKSMLSSIIAVRVTPRSSRPGVGEWRLMADGREALEVRVRAAPDGGSANQEMIELLSGALSVPKRDIEIVSGGSSRLKRVSCPLSEDDVRMRVA